MDRQIMYEHGYCEPEEYAECEKKNMNHIKIIVNEGGVVSEILASPKIAKDLSVEVIDFCTDNSAEYFSAEKRLEHVEEMIGRGELESVIW